MDVPANIAILVKDLNALAERAGAVLFVDSGTLLGIVRDGQLLPNDADVDVSITDATAFENLVNAASGARVWHFAGQPYKAEIALGPGLVLDVKLFRRAGADWVSPAVGTALPSEKPAPHWKRALKPLWRWMLAHGDASRFPLRQLARIDAWVVPQEFFAGGEPIGGISCRVPDNATAYLAYRYGADWKIPKSDWNSRRDDGGYRRDQKAALLRSLNS